MLFLPIRSKNPPESVPYVTIALIAINVVAFFLTAAGAYPEEDLVRAYGLNLASFRWYQLFTSMFLHGDLSHLAGNMWFLYLFGFAVEGRLRPLKFALLYFLAGICGEVLHAAFSMWFDPSIPTIGASGAIMGVMGAALFMFPYSFVEMFYWVLVRAGIANWHMRWVAAFYLGQDLLSAMLIRHSGVAHAVHLGGALGGFLLAMAFGARRDRAEISAAKAIVATTADLSHLTAYELKGMWEGNPSDLRLLLEWYFRSMQEAGSPDPAAKEAVKANLSAMIESCDPLPVGTLVIGIASEFGRAANGMLIHLGTKLAESGNAKMSLKLYEAVLRNDPSADDAPSAVFRMALVFENCFFDFAQAAVGYRHVIAEFPMSPFADQAKLRVSALERLGKISG